MKLEEGLFTQHKRAEKHTECSCRFFAAFLLHEIKIDVIITGHISEKASQLFARRGITVLPGVKGKIYELLQEYVARVG
ncbi:NifB/NifX family molybdenum-iron cluster-binding protein [Desulfosporosinus hippei]|uniref:Dinitrogenase iron-molybdenum cofactor n=1 Tax=Desulfosporosinus hippei DSM 8344 TaxID=1121419 RepID=A0A1G8G2G1_9FIRM|nr:Dinitrogenase iron-molybdenum cofactor [Desulfosporosinus hippei DSM 8344]